MKASAPARKLKFIDPFHFVNSRSKKNLNSDAVHGIDHQNDIRHAEFDVSNSDVFTSFQPALPTAIGEIDQDKFGFGIQSRTRTENLNLFPIPAAKPRVKKEVVTHEEYQDYR